MRAIRSSGLLVAAAFLGNAGGNCLAQQAADEPASPADLSFSVSEGRSDNYFIRERGISGHLNLRTDPMPRLIVAFPAGNSGAAVWFDEVEGDRVWGPVTNLEAIENADDAGRPVYGIQADIAIEARSISIDRADLGSVRFLRNAVDYSALPHRDAPAMRVDANAIRISRERPDGESSYDLQLRVLEGRLDASDGLRLIANAQGHLKIRIAATSGDPLEPPVSIDGLLTAKAGESELLRNAFSFLTYRTKMLAGSWRFLTYFGRDTLLSLRLLMPVLTADAAEIGLGSVLARVNENGEVAHEEEIGELAVYRNMAERNVAVADPVYDYKMVDDNLQLAPVLLAYVTTFGADRAGEFLSGNTSDGVPLRSKLLANLQLVARQARAFANDPKPANLVSINAGFNVGNWRDSQEGLVGGRYPYDVNAVLMPAALHAAAELLRAGLLGDAADSLPSQREFVDYASVWEAKATDIFAVSMPADAARRKMRSFARSNSYPLADIPDKELSFRAVSLTADFEPIPVMHSDTINDLLFLRRPEVQLQEIVANLTRPFPAGLMTPVGILAANPAFAGEREQALVTPNNYHGTVVWSWQQAAIIAGLDTQLRRHDLSAPVRGELNRARHLVEHIIRSNEDFINTELWSIETRGNQFTIAPFGQRGGHLTESNVIQLWSTVFLGLTPRSPAQ